MHDIIFHVIYGSDEDTIREFVHASSARIQCITKCQYLEATMQQVLHTKVPIDVLKTLFFLLLNVDMVLKEYVVDSASKAAFAAAMNVKPCTDGLVKLHAWSMVGSRPMSTGKARNFFVALQKDVVKQWLQDERRTPRDFMEAVTQEYLNS